jgi:hypothetical protein
MASAHCYCGICVKIDMACIPFTSLHKNRLSTEYSPLDPPSGRNRCEQKEDRVEQLAIRHLQTIHIAVGL